MNFSNVPAYSTYYLWLSIILLGLNLLTVIWSYGDAEKRGKPGCLVALLVGLFAWPFGWIIWLIFRPGDEAIKAHKPQQNTSIRGIFRSAAPIMFCDECGSRLIETEDALVCPQCSSFEED